MTRPIIDTADPSQRNKLHLQYLSPKEKKRQAFWRCLLDLGRQSIHSRLVDARDWLTEQHERQQEEAYKNRRQILELKALRERRQQRRRQQLNLQGTSEKVGHSSPFKPLEKERKKKGKEMEGME